jgi:hypothetical protein
MVLIYVCSTRSVVVLKARFENWKARNDLYGVSLFHLSYLMTLMAYLCSQSTPNVQIKYFMFDWSIYRLFVLNRCWKRHSLQIMIFAYVRSTWDTFTPKTRFDTWIARNDVNGVSLFHLSNLITLMAYLCSHRTPNVQIKYFRFDRSFYHIFVLNRARNVILSKWDIRKGLLDMKHGWTKNVFWDVNNKICRKWCKIVSPTLFYNTYGLPMFTMNIKLPNQVFYV